MVRSSSKFLCRKHASPLGACFQSDLQTERALFLGLSLCGHSSPLELCPRLAERSMSWCRGQGYRYRWNTFLHRILRTWIIYGPLWTWCGKHVLMVSKQIQIRSIKELYKTYLSTDFWLTPNQTGSIEDIEIIKPRIPVVPAMEIYFISMYRSRMVVPTSRCRSKRLGLIVGRVHKRWVRCWLRHRWRIVNRRGLAERSIDCCTDKISN